MSKHMKKLSKRLIEIGLIIASLFLAMFILEIILRLFIPIYLTGYIGSYQYDKELGYRLKDNFDFLLTTDYQQEIHTNKLGTVNFQDNFNDYKVLVFALGDSFTQGTGLPADASYPFQLDLLLNMENNHYVPLYGIVNLGLAAFGGEQNLLTLKRYAKRLGKPKVILYLGCSNDYKDDVLFRSGYRHKHMVDGSPYWGWYMQPLAWMTNETEIGKHLKVLIGEFRRKKIFSKAPNRSGKEGTEAKKPNAAELEAPVFQELIKISQEYGAKLIISWIDLPDNQEGYQWLQDFAQKHHVAFADWYPAVVSARQSVPQFPLNNPHSGGHYRTWVNGQIARAFAKEIHAKP
jgi:hypothetical protein